MYKIFATTLFAVTSIIYTSTALASLVGKFQGEFSVNQGQANYNIPIEVVDGINNLQPNIALNYNSASGNSLVGMGWQLAGISVISRCGSNLAEDGNTIGITYTYQDKYCLDGKRLILTKGTYGKANSEYKTAIDSYSRIIGLGQQGQGVASFQVSTKDGKTLTFGKDTNSRLIAKHSSAIHLWSISSISDSYNNTIEYTYHNTPNIFAIASISYSAHKINFSYQDRLDISTGFFHNQDFSQNQRLHKIQVFANNQLKNSYTLAYRDPQDGWGKSLLQQIIKCDSNQQCFTPIKANWDVTSLERFKKRLHTPATHIATSTHIGDGMLDVKRIKTGDFNGDGLTDIYHVQGWGDTAQDIIYLNNGDTFEQTAGVHTYIGDSI
jgi:hypothetical protein